MKQKRLIDTMGRLRFLSLVTLLLVLSRVDGLFFSPTHCNLNCKRGTCHRVAGDADTLSYAVQSGKLIQECVCEPGYGGLGCDIAVPECSSSDRGCNSRTLHCSTADSISRFASQMCRKTYTEYCTERYDPNAPLPFCTNGGKCKSGLIGAKIAPRNTTVNHDYENLGCACPPEFYGPHCEFLRHASADTYDESINPTEEQKGFRKPTLKELMIGLSVLVTFVFLAMCLHCRRRRKRNATLAPTENDLAQSLTGETATSNETPFKAQRVGVYDDSSTLTGLFRDENTSDEINDQLLLREVSIPRIDMSSNGRDSPTRFFLD